MSQTKKSIMIFLVVVLMLVFTTGIALADPPLQHHMYQKMSQNQWQCQWGIVEAVLSPGCVYIGNGPWGS